MQKCLKRKKSLDSEIRYKMLPKWHFLLGAIFSLLLWPVFGSGSLVIFTSSFLVDFDHYLWYVKRTKNCNPFKAYYAMKKLSKNKKRKKHLLVFHTIEFWILLLAASFYSRFAFLVLIGIAFHMSLDFSSKEQRDKRAISSISFLRQKQLRAKKQNI